MNQYAPGASVPLVAALGSTGIASQLTVGVVNSVSEAVARAASNTGIVERDGGIYSVEAFTTPTTAGYYRVEWYRSTTLVYYDEFEVTSSAFVVTSASPEDSRLTQLITAASRAVMSYCQREFAPVSTSTTRTFPLNGDGFVRFGGWDLQSASLVQIDTDAASTPVSIPASQYMLGPVSAPNGVYSYLQFYSFTVGPILRQWAGGIPRQVSVTGTWGWPSIPADVEQATIITVAKWFKRDQVAWSSELPVPSGPGDGLSLPYDARVLLAPYRRPV